MKISGVSKNLFFLLCIIINSNRVHSTASTAAAAANVTWEDEEFSNTTGIIKQRHRVKRTLAFQPGTRIMVRIFEFFFPIHLNPNNNDVSLLLYPTKFRVNTKDNIIKVNQIFAHGFGFRGNIDLTQPNRESLLPSEQELHHRSRKRRNLTRRDVYETLEELINQ